MHTADGALGARADVVIGSITSGDFDIIRERPALAASKYALMASDAFAFFRGSLALFLRDWNDPEQPLQATQFSVEDARPFGIGDPHPENFGVLRSPVGVFRVEPNDFDTADRLPYLWDVRRFAVGMCLAARLANPSDAAVRAATGAQDRTIARAAVASYADTLTALAAGGPRPVIEDGGGNAILDDLFARSLTDWEKREELGRLSKTDGGVRQLVRGTPDAMEPEQTTRELPSRARLGVAPSIASYLPTLPAPPAVTDIVPLDAVQVFGQGIGSLPRLRALVLTRGPSTDTADDIILEIKELPPQGSLPLPDATSFPSPQVRVLAALAAGWTEPGADPLWGAGTWSGLPAQFRSEAAGHKTLRVSRLDGALGTPAAIEGMGVALARLIARMHAAPVRGASVAGPISATLAADLEGFADEQADVALAYCNQVLSDWDLFKQALLLLGPTLGVMGDSALAATPDLRVLYDPLSDPRSAGVDAVVGPLTINELSATGSEYVELQNVSKTTQNIAGFGVADSDVDGGPRFDLASFFAPGVALAPGARMTVLGGFDPVIPGPQSNCKNGIPVCYQAAWDISASRGETLYLLTAEKVIADQATYPPTMIENSQSWSRLPDGSGQFSVGNASPGKPNVGP